MPANKYDEIAAAAVQLFYLKGYHATSVQDIADAVGLQKGSLYHYIGGKEELLQQIVTRAVMRFRQQIEHICDLPEPAPTRLRLAVRQHMRIVTGEVEMTTLLFRDAFLLGGGQHEAIRVAMDGYTELWTRMISEGVTAGEFTTADAKLAALSLLGACNWAYRWFRRDGALSADQLADRMCELYLRGLLAPDLTLA
ncbi:MAG: TetR/AcrR family transcriptional regulator [Firmicutes bacterium]|nr:TetR/AcrR family transcriptional regulator [Bacillota bacterium]